jgi:hypothetical protein
MNKINDLKVGDRVIRYFHQLSAEDMYVIEISDDVIVCALRPDATNVQSPVWAFSRESGEELETSVPGLTARVATPVSEP